MKFWLYILASMALFALSAPAAPKPPKESDITPPPPMPQGVNVSLYLGHSVEIPLRAIGRAPTQLRFIIRIPPKHGRLSVIDLTGNKTALVTYIHDEKEGLAPDSFTYAVQGADGPVSASGTVNITVSEEPPAFSASVAEIEFPRLWVGQTSEQQVTIANKGGGLLQGKVSVPAPWKIVGDDSYALARKQETTIRLAFAPTDDGAFRSRLIFSHDGRATVSLIGSAANPLDIVPVKKLEFTTASATDTVRTTHFTVRNVTPDERVVRFTLPESIQAPPGLILPAGAERTIDLKTSGTFLTPLEDHLVVESEGFREELDLIAPAIPAILQITPAKIDLGQIEGGRHYKSALTVQNTGGEPAHLQAKTPRGVLLVPDPNSEVVAPGETRVFEVSLESPGEGAYQGDIEISAEGAASVTVSLTAKILPPPPVTNQPMAAPTLAPRDSSTQSTPAEISTHPLGIELLKIGPYEVEIGWKKPAPNIATYQLEVRTLKVKPGTSPENVWVPWKEVKFLDEGGRSVARIEHMAAGQTLFFRVRSIDTMGHLSDPSEVVLLSSLPARHNWLWWLGVLVLIGIVVFLVKRFRQQREQEARLDAARLAHIQGR